MDLGMDMWKYYGITHTDHTVMNPLSLEKTRELVGLLRLPEGGRVLDVACGKADSTAEFAAPEVSRTGSLEFTSETDVYSLGMLLSQLFLFPCDPLFTITAAQRPSPRKLEELRQWSPLYARLWQSGLPARFQMATAENPGDRYSSATQLWADVVKCLAEAGLNTA